MPVKELDSIFDSFDKDLFKLRHKMITGNAESAKDRLIVEFFHEVKQMDDPKKFKNGFAVATYRVFTLYPKLVSKEELINSIKILKDICFDEKESFDLLSSKLKSLSLEVVKSDNSTEKRVLGGLLTLKHLPKNPSPLRHEIFFRSDSDSDSDLKVVRSDSDSDSDLKEFQERSVLLGADDYLIIPSPITSTFPNTSKLHSNNGRE